jgi:hypothetical protein
MIARLAVFVWTLACCSALAGCDPSDACDRGYYADHGFCYLSDGGFDWVSDAQTTDGEDGGAPTQNPNAKFGTPCTLQSECGGTAPVCGGPMLPVCTQINCLDDSTLCPDGWTCIDVTKYMASAPGVNSVCINL